MGFWHELDLNRQTATWISHALIGLAVVCLGLFVGHYLPGGPFLYGAVTGTIQALYFGLMREPSDLRLHEARGDSRTDLGQGVTPRVDRYGDQISNWAIGGVAVTLYLASLWWASSAIIGGLIGALLAVMKVRQALSLGEP